jgi:anti-sigma factor RsiW
MREPSRARPETCLSDRALDMMLAGELAPAALTQAQRHLPGCAACSARHRELEAGRRAFALEAPAFAKVVATVKPARPARRGWLFGGAFATVAAAAMLLVLRAFPDDDAVRTKGGDKLAFFVDHQGAVREGGPGEVVRAGDRLQLVYTTSKPRYLAVFLRDAKGAVTVAFPRATTAAKLEAGANVPLPYSLELDGALGVETLVGLFCDRPPPLEVSRRALELQGDRAAWPDGCRVERSSYEKR